MYQLCRVYPACYLCKRTLYSLALGSHIVKLLTILLAPLCRLYVAGCARFSACPAALFGDCARTYSWAIRAVNDDEPKREMEYLH